ncbi:MAG: hypothetical protein ACI8ZN_002596 [Bacteroidia bacterium]|jgi:hypothetical protein
MEDVQCKIKNLLTMTLNFPVLQLGAKVKLMLVVGDNTNHGGSG